MEAAPTTGGASEPPPPAAGASPTAEEVGGGPAVEATPTTGGTDNRWRSWLDITLSRKLINFTVVASETRCFMHISSNLERASAKKLSNPDHEF